jgi:streptogramin lyase
MKMKWHLSRRFIIALLLIGVLAVALFLYVCVIPSFTKPPSSTLVQYPIPTTDGAFAIAAGPDGNLWFTDGSAKIWWITTNGSVTMFTLSTQDSLLLSIVAGQDGNLWFTDMDLPRIGHITL